MKGLWRHFNKSKKRSVPRDERSIVERLAALEIQEVVVDNASKAGRIRKSCIESLDRLRNCLGHSFGHIDEQGKLGKKAQKNFCLTWLEGHSLFEPSKIPEKIKKRHTKIALENGRAFFSPTDEQVKGILETIVHIAKVTYDAEIKLRPRFFMDPPG